MNKITRRIKQTFCKHEGDYFTFSGKELFKKCKKCGKLKIVT